jgi:hypothetical protein
MYKYKNLQMMSLDHYFIFQISLRMMGSVLYSSVPDRRIRNIPEVVLVRRWVSWGSGNLERGGLGEGWWTIPVTARRVPSK